MDLKDETVLLDEIKRGDGQAFHCLFSRYYRRLLGYASRFVDDYMVAEDLVQDSFARLWEKREMLESVSLSSLLFTIVRNNCINHLKRQALVDIHSVDWLENLDGEERLYNLDFCPDVEMTLLYKELMAQIPQVLEQLPPRSREIFLMSRRQGLKNREIAERLAISTTAVEKHIKRALESFEQYFKEKYPVDVCRFAILIYSLMC
jgi:RNA polymerase sigma-70 factor (ECF subfamily)